MPEIVATTEKQVIDAVQAARASKTSFEIVGAGTKRAFGRPANCDTRLNVSGLRGIVDYRPEELIITVEPGTFVAEITAALAAKNQRLGFDPPDLGALFDAPENIGTIGGAISCDLNGPASLRFGRVRDHLLGIRAVNGFGEVFKAGGKVVKNVTGFDIPKLVCGAFGTLCVLTEVTLRVFPKPPISEVYAIGGVSAEDGLSVLRKIWNSSIEATSLSLLSEPAWRLCPGIERTESEKYELDDEGDEECGPVNDCAAVIRLEGSAASLDQKRSMLGAIAEGFHPMLINDGSACLQAVGSGTSFSDTMEDVWLWTLPPASCSSVVERHHNSVWVADCAGGRLWERGTPGNDGEWRRKEANKLGGTVSLIRASAETRARVAPFPPLSPERLALTRSVKAAFDPLGLFNPGRMYNGI